MDLFWPANLSVGKKQDIAKVLCKLKLNSRLNIRKAQATGVNVNHMIGASHVVESYNASQNPGTHFALTAGLGGQAVIESLKSGIKKYKHTAKHFTQAMNKLNEKQRLLVKNEISNKEFRLLAARDYNNANNAMAKAARLNMVGNETRDYFNTFNRSIKRARIKHITVSDLSDATHLVKIGAVSSRVGHGVTAFNLVVGGHEVFETYKHGGNWEQQASGVGAEIAFTGAASDAAADIIVGGVCAFLSFTPAGWVVLIAGAVVAGILSIFFSKGFEDLGERGYVKADELIHWVKQYEKRWH